MSITFDFEGLTFNVFESVYEPAQDSFLLAKHAMGLRGRVLEIGCGTGIVSISNAAKNPGNTVLGCDINKAAVLNARYNAKANGIKNVKFVRSNLFSKIKGKFDFLLFNPPYLPTSKGEKLRGAINKAYDGGKDGRETLDKFLFPFPSHLKDGGAAMIIHSSLNGIEKTRALLAKKGFSIEALEEEKFFFEKLQVLKITKA